MATSNFRRSFRLVKKMLIIDAHQAAIKVSAEELKMHAFLR
jgi:hypothetical protein